MLCDVIFLCEIVGVSFATGNYHSWEHLAFSWSLFPTIVDLVVFFKCGPANEAKAPKKALGIQRFLVKVLNGGFPSSLFSYVF